MAQDIVRNRPDVVRSALKPKFYICNDGHLHWLLGWPGIDGCAFPMDQRLQLEWFWKHLTPSQRTFWKPHLKLVDSLIIQYMEVAEQRELTLEEEGSFREAAHALYENAAKEYARLHGVTMGPEEDFSICCGAAYAVIVLKPNVKNVAAIQWVTAGTLWISLSTTGLEPEYQTYAPGARVPVAPGSLYYYRLVLRDGRQSQRILAPAIIESSDLILAWR